MIRRVDTFFSKVRFRFAPLAIWQSEVIRFVNPNCEISIRSCRDGSGDFNYESKSQHRYRHRVVFGKLIRMALNEKNFTLRVKVLILKCLVCVQDYFCSPLENPPEGSTFEQLIKQYKKGIWFCISRFNTSLQIIKKQNCTTLWKMSSKSLFVQSKQLSREHITHPYLLFESQWSSKERRSCHIWLLIIVGI